MTIIMSAPLLSSSEIDQMLRKTKNTTMKYNMKNKKNAVTFTSGYALTVKYKPMHIQLHDPATHTYVMYFQLLPLVNRNIATSQKMARSILS